MKSPKKPFTPSWTNSHYSKRNHTNWPKYTGTRPTRPDREPISNSHRKYVVPASYAPHRDDPAGIAAAIYVPGMRPDVPTFTTSTGDSYRAEVASVAFALRHCIEFERITLVTSRMIRDNIERYLQGWRRDQWSLADGKRIAACESWQAIAERLEVLNVLILSPDNALPDFAASLHARAHAEARDAYLAVTQPPDISLIDHHLDL